MKKLKLIASLGLLCFLSTPALWGQSQKPFSIRAGYSATAVRIDGAAQPSERLYNKVNDSKTFWGDGVEGGLSKAILPKVVVDAGFATISGRGTKAKIVSDRYNAEHYYSLKGFQLPITCNFQVTPPERKFRFLIGAGLQLLHLKFQQYQHYVDDTGGWTEAAQRLTFTDVQIAGKATAQYRLNERFSIMTHYKASVSHRGRLVNNAFAGLAYSIN
jgi:hypothetical protein